MSLLSLFMRSNRIGMLGLAVLASCGGRENAIPTQQVFDRTAESAAASSTAVAAVPGEPETGYRTDAAVPTFVGCAIFPSGDYYNADITHAAVDAHSAQYLSSVEAVDDTGFGDSLGLEPVNVADNKTPLFKVKPKVYWHPFPVEYPWASGFEIEDIGDAHYVAVNRSSCHLYEAYGASFRDGVFSAYSGKDYDLKKPFKIGGGVMASGLSYFAGAVRHEEVVGGIHHALNLAVWQNALCDCFTAPAAESDGVRYEGRSSPYELPYGAHLRLKAHFDCSTWGPQAAAICNALKRYGLYTADTDGHYVDNNKLFFVNPTDGGRWNGDDLAALRNLKFSDFEVLRISKVSN